MLDRRIIQPSRAPFYGHALMVPKSNNKWRFVIDFTKLNLATGKEGWPIPNIEKTKIFHRLGPDEWIFPNTSIGRIKGLYGILSIESGII